MDVFLCEKPTQAKDLAKVLGRQVTDFFMMVEVDMLPGPLVIFLSFILFSIKNVVSVANGGGSQ